MYVLKCLVSLYNRNGFPRAVVEILSDPQPRFGNLFYFISNIMSALDIMYVMVYLHLSRPIPRTTPRPKPIMCRKYTLGLRPRPRPRQSHNDSGLIPSYQYVTKKLIKFLFVRTYNIVCMER